MRAPAPGQVFLVLVSGSSDAFEVLSRARTDMDAVLQGSNVLQSLGDACQASPAAGLRVDALPRAAGGWCGGGLGCT
jgi:hypothetical protein